MSDYIYNHNNLKIVFGLDLSSGPSNIIVLYNDKDYDILFSVVLFDQALWINEFDYNKTINSLTYQNTLQFEFSPLYI